MAQNNTKKADKTEQNKKEKCKQRLQTAAYFLIIVAVIAVLFLLMNFVLDPAVMYYSAGQKAKEGDYSGAVAMYEKLDGFLNSEKKIFEIKTLDLQARITAGDYAQAVRIAEESNDMDAYIAEYPEIFYEYAKAQAAENPAAAKVYIAYVPDYPGAAALYDEICLRNAQSLCEAGRYADVLLNFDEASSLDWLLTLEPAAAYEYATDMAQYSYVRAAKVFETVQDVNPASKEKREALENYLQYCGEKTCVSDTADGAMVNAVNVFDFFTMDEAEYLAVVDGNAEAVYTSAETTYVKDADGSYFAVANDLDAGLSYLYRFYMLENGSIEEKTTVTTADGSEFEYTRLWS